MCPAGDHMMALSWDKKLHLCHRTFGQSNNPIFNRFIFEPEDLDKACMVGETVHRDKELRVNLGLSIVNQLANTGQISEIYKNEFAAYILSKFVNETIFCPLDNIDLTGSPFLSQAGTYILYGNGALEYHIKSSFEGI
jgi:hypothetical protein